MPGHVDQLGAGTHGAQAHGCRSSAAYPGTENRLGLRATPCAAAGSPPGAWTDPEGVRSPARGLAGPRSAAGRRACIDPAKPPSSVCAATQPCWVRCKLSNREAPQRRGMVLTYGGKRLWASLATDCGDCASQPDSRCGVWRLGWASVLGISLESRVGGNSRARSGLLQLATQLSADADELLGLARRCELAQAGRRIEERQAAALLAFRKKKS